VRSWFALAGSIPALLLILKSKQMQQMQINHLISVEQSAPTLWDSLQGTAEEKLIAIGKGIKMSDHHSCKMLKESLEREYERVTILVDGFVRVNPLYK
jgi:hypothetical protein